MPPHTPCHPTTPPRGSWADESHCFFFEDPKWGEGDGSGAFVHDVFAALKEKGRIEIWDRSMTPEQRKTFWEHKGA